MQPNDDKVVCKALVDRSEWQKNGIQPASAKLLIADYTFDTCNGQSGPIAEVRSSPKNSIDYWI